MKRRDSLVRHREDWQDQGYDSDGRVWGVCGLGSFWNPHSWTVQLRIYIYIYIYIYVYFFKFYLCVCVLLLFGGGVGNSKPAYSVEAAGF